MSDDEPLDGAIFGCDSRLRTTLSRFAFVRGHRVDIPEGYKLAKGPIQPGDKYLNQKRFPPDIEWLDCPLRVDILDMSSDRGTRNVQYYGENFDLAIRPITKP